VGVITGATGVAFSVGAAEQELLNPEGVNAIRELSGAVRIWGARTLATDNDYIYVAVRRLALYIEESVQEGTSWAVFEPNDPDLWSQLRLEVEDFLHGLWMQGWLQGTTPEDAYFVRCDLTTMTQQDLEQGRTVLLLGFAPLRPAEFLVQRIVQDRSSATASPPRPGAAAVLLPAAPNPFNPRTTLRFELPVAAPVDLRILDVAGRLVAVLRSGAVMDAGLHAAAWDGRDRLGRAVASGSYVARLEAGGRVRTTRLCLVR
jgi:hypothetical protein